MLSGHLKRGAAFLAVLPVFAVGWSASASAASYTVKGSAPAGMGSRVPRVEIAVPRLPRNERFIPNSGLQSIVCGGHKVLPPSNTPQLGWQTYPTGGYVGEGCGSGIDYIFTPTNGYADYNFGTTDGRSYTFEAWIPTVHATALTDFVLLVCGMKIGDLVVDEAPVSGWYTLFGLSGYESCDVDIRAETGVQHEEEMGLDAIRSHT